MDVRLVRPQITSALRPEGAALLVALVPLYTDVVNISKVPLMASYRRLVVASLLAAKVVDHINAVDVRLVLLQTASVLRFIVASLLVARVEGDIDATDTRLVLQSTS